MFWIICSASPKGDPTVLVVDSRSQVAGAAAPSPDQSVFLEQDQFGHSGSLMISRQQQINERYSAKSVSHVKRMERGIGEMPRPWFCSATVSGVHSLQLISAR